MLFQEFVNEVADRILDYLPAEYKHATVGVGTMRKLNEEYTSLTVRNADQAITPNINLNQMFEKIEKGRPMHEVLSSIAGIIDHAQLEVDPNIMKDYSSVKDKLFIRVSNVEKNQELLDDAPHQSVGDLAVTYHVLVETGENEIGSYMVKNQMLETFGISRDQLHADAMENSPKILPPFIESMEDTMNHLLAGKQRDTREFGSQLQDVTLKEGEMLILTNREFVNGAAVPFYPGVLEKIAEQVDGNFFVLPSSVHEVILVADDGSVPLKELESVVKSINQTELQPQDFLSDHVYHFDKDTRMLELGQTYEARKAELSQNAERPAERVSIRSQLREAEKVCEHQLPKPKVPGKETMLE